jgi:hypothetical protein
MLYKGQFSGAPTFLVPLALSSQWFHSAVVSPVGKEPVLVTHTEMRALLQSYF